MRSTRLAGAVLATAMAAMAAALAGCSGAAPEPAPGASDAADPTAASGQPAVGYRDETNGFGINPPPGWQIGSGPTQAAVTFVLPAPDTSAGPPVVVNMNIVATQAEGDLASNVAEARQQLPGLAPGYQSVADEPVTLPSGQQGHLLGSVFTQQAPLRNLQLVVVVPGRLYVVTGTAPAASFAKHEPAIRQSMMSFVML